MSAVSATHSDEGLPKAVEPLADVGAAAEGDVRGVGRVHHARVALHRAVCGAAGGGEAR